MNKNRIKAYAPNARREFIQAVTDRAHLLGLSLEAIEPVTISGDIALIAGRPFPKIIAEQRKRLEARIQREGFNQVMDEIAYTWFNRFTALRYMELHEYLGHGYRVLSNPSGNHIPEILEKAEQIDLPGLNRDEVIEMKLAGKRDAELYRKLLVAQCNALNSAMPFLFERINDETELLLPDNLLHSNSLIRKLVTEVEEEDWQEVEIIGWLYQFYTSEKKDEVIGKVVKSEDIPAATQLFTPNWIVKYMVQNSLGRYWLATYPNSPLRNQMEYYIEPASQSDEVNAQLAAITPKQIDPEAITLLDPACGSGHILVEAYDLLKEIYLERGYRLRDIPRLILEKNLYGLDIDDRAAQLSGFALLMKARSDDRRVLDIDVPQMNVMAIQSSAGLNITEIANALLPQKEKPRRIIGNEMLFADMEKQMVLTVTETDEIDKADEAGKVNSNDIILLMNLFEHGKIFGSLISIPDNLANKLADIEKLINEIIEKKDLLAIDAAKLVLPFVEQAKVLVKKYDCVVANPPYMNGKYFNANLKNYLQSNFLGYEKDLFAAFIKQNLYFVKPYGLLGFVAPFVWMFISSYDILRSTILETASLNNLVKPSYTAFFDSAIVPLVTFIIQNKIINIRGEYFDLGYLGSADLQPIKFKEAINNPHCGYRYQSSANDFKRIPGSPIAYWVSDKERELYEKGELLGSFAQLRKGLDTGDNSTFLRLWTEINRNHSVLVDGSLEDSLNGFKWFPYNKGGEYRKWYGNREYVINWQNNGAAIKSRIKNKTKKPTLRNKEYYFREGYTWTTVSSSNFSARYCPNGALFDNGGSTLFSDGNLNIFGALCNSKIGQRYLEFLSPTLNFQPGDVGRILYIPIKNKTHIQQFSNQIPQLIDIAKVDWDSFETSWDFQRFPLLTSNLKSSTIEQSFTNWQSHCTAQIKRMQELETENNRLFIEAYGLQDEMSPEVPEDQITLARADQGADIKRLISYAIGCMMGRYSLDQPGLVYAQSGNEDFDLSKYPSFPADADGIIPLLDFPWFDDDVTKRLEEFIKVAWSPETLNENLTFIANSLSAKAGEDPRDAIRRYLSSQFYKDHIQTYKKRPIYWLFSSGKQRAFECLVYLHRYTESTLSRMRNEYVTPLQGKFSAQAEYLKNEIAAANSTAQRNKLQKQLEVLKKKQEELAKFDDQLRHYADKRIKLDLDDGVKVNYGKFGPLLAETKTIAAESE